jgi:predicted ArsR family transcriptional regulator
MVQPGTPNLMRELNERSLLGALQMSGPATRPHLAKLTGLSKPTVSVAMANLEQAGLVLQVGQSGGGRGPSATVYAENEKAGLILAIDLSQGGVHGALADLAGNVLQRSDQSGPLRSYNALVGALDRATERLREAVPAGLDIVQTVVAISGVYDPRRNELRFAALTPGGSGRSLLSELQQRFGPALLIATRRASTTSCSSWWTPAWAWGCCSTDSSTAVLTARPARLPTFRSGSRHELARPPRFDRSVRTANEEARLNRPSPTRRF